MKITHCFHSAVLVSNLDQSENFYSNILGLSKIDRPLKYPGVWYQLGEFQIHLIVDPDLKKVKQQNTEKWGRNPHIAFAVTDLNAAKEQLLSHGYEIQMSASGRPALFTQDPDGNIIELTEV